MIIKLTNKLDSDEWHLDWSETSFFKNKKKERKTGNQINYGLRAHLYKLEGAVRRIASRGLIPPNKVELLCNMTETWGESTIFKWEVKAKEGDPGHSQSYSPEFNEVV